MFEKRIYFVLSHTPAEIQVPGEEEKQINTVLSLCVGAVVAVTDISCSHWSVCQKPRAKSQGARYGLSTMD